MGVQIAWFIDVFPRFSRIRSIVDDRSPYDLECMDVNGSYPLVVGSSDQGPLVPASVPVSPIILGYDSFDDDSAADVVDPLWQFLCLLSLLLQLALETIEFLRRQVVELRCQAHYWRAQHERAVQREADSKDEIQRLKAEIRELERRLYGRKSEASSATNPKPPQLPTNPKPRSRGQQRGSKGHGRRHHDHLTTKHENCDLPHDQKCCSCCGEPFEEIPGTADGDILEIDVRAHRRRYHRQRYRRCCTCPGQPAVITAPPPDKLFPKSIIGISLWVLILQRKFQFFQPLYRILAELRGYDLHLSAGTITDGLRKLEPLLQPLYELLVEHNRNEGHWHCDETRWLVFVKRSDKPGFAWNLWVFAAKESIVFVLDPTRAHDVPEGHFGDDGKGIVNVDRYSAYKAMAQVKSGKIVLAFCWAHVRRDFLAVLTSWSELTDWAWSWVEEIGELYQRNDKRLALKDKDIPTEYAEADRLVREHVEHIQQRRDRELLQPDLRQPQRKVLKSLQNHWSGLTVFVDHPEVPLDNNKAERCHRGPVVGRKNFYGSGSLWSGRLAAMLFSLFQTIQAWEMDVGRWLTAYLLACAKAKGKPPPDPQLYLPWNMSPEQRQRLSLAKPQSPHSGPEPPEPKPPPDHPVPAT
jgi:transposase